MKRPQLSKTPPPPPPPPPPIPCIPPPITTTTITTKTTIISTKNMAIMQTSTVLDKHAGNKQWQRDKKQPAATCSIDPTNRHGLVVSPAGGRRSLDDLTFLAPMPPNRLPQTTHHGHYNYSDSESSSSNCSESESKVDNMRCEWNRHNAAKIQRLLDKFNKRIAGKDEISTPIDKKKSTVRFSEDVTLVTSTEEIALSVRGQDIMGNSVSCLKGKSEPASAITLAIIGPDDAGKTTLSSVLAGEPLDPHVAPTVGFRNVKFTLKKYDVTLYDLGGGKGIRPIWKNYYSEIYGVIYMVDSSSNARLKEARDLLRDTLEHPQVSGKPLLVLANKVDLEGHMEEVDIVNQLDLDRTVNVHNCPSRFLMISALQSSKAKMKKVVVGGFMWLLGAINSSMDSLEPRVKEDMGAVKEMRDREREERRERVRKQREERERLEEEERKRLGITKDEDEEEEELDIEKFRGDPFKLLNFNKLKHEQNQRIAEKKRRQQQLLDSEKPVAADRKDLQRLKEESRIGYSMDDTMTLPRFGQSRFGRNANLDGLDISHSSALMPIQGRNTRPTALPPLEPITAQSLDSKMISAEKKKGKKKKPSDVVASSYGDERLENGGGGDLMGRSEFRSHGLSKHFGSEYEADSLGGGRDMMRRPDYRQMLRSTGDRDDDREYMRNNRDELGHLDFNQHGSRSYASTESDVHDLTPRVAKPKNNRMVKTGSRIDEDEKEDALNQYKNLRMSLKEYGDPRMSQKLDEYRDKYPLRSSSDTRENQSSESKYPLRYSSDSYSKDTKRRDKGYEREDSMYRKSLKNISPPNLDRFDDDDRDEGIEDDSDNGSESVRRSSGNNGLSSYGRYDKKTLSSNKHGKRDINANRRRTQYSDEEEEEEEEDYGSRNKLRDTLKFSRYDDGEYSKRDYEKDIMNLKYRRDNDYKSKRNNLHNEEDSDDGRMAPSGHGDQRRKKKKNILKSNKLMPSDDDDDREVSLSQRYSSPRLVQEHGSRQTSDADTPSHGRNSRTTSYFNRGSASSGPKWSLAEDLPTIDNDSRLRRNFRPNYDDSDGDDIAF